MLGTIGAPSTAGDDFTAAGFLADGDLLGRELTLTLELDGPTGSSILLDSISFAGLVNGKFAAGDLTGWTLAATGSGSAGVLTILAVPEPRIWPLVAVGLGLVGVATHRRSKQAHAAAFA